MKAAAQTTNQPVESLTSQVRKAVIWRSGSQILAQLVMWTSTFLVIRILDPRDYGLYAMTQVVLVLLGMLNGYGFASAIVQKPEVSEREIRQLFGLLIVFNAALALTQIAAAPLVAAYYRQPAVIDLLRVQALLFATTPLTALPYALLSRAMDFKKQAQANLAGSLAGAVTALGGALAGLGVWTLVIAPMTILAVRGLVMMTLARAWRWPSFDFRGAGYIWRYGWVMTLGQLFWFLQSQADVFIAGRHFDPHLLGIYTTALFLTQIFVAKFVPALNEVAFTAYARIQHDRRAMAHAFARATRIIMVVGMPFYLGLAAVAEPLVLTVLGEKWRETIPVVHLLAFAMPMMTLQVLFTPACDAAGKPGIGVGNGAIGAAVLTAGFLIGVNWGVTGLAAAWIVAYPIYLALSAWRALPVIGVRVAELAEAIAPPAFAAVAMALVVTLADRALPAMAPQWRLVILIAIGGAAYGAWLLIFSRHVVRELIAIVRKQPLSNPA